MKYKKIGIIVILLLILCFGFAKEFSVPYDLELNDNDIHNVDSIDCRVITGDFLFFGNFYDFLDDLDLNDNDIHNVDSIDCRVITADDTLIIGTVADTVVTIDNFKGIWLTNLETSSENDSVIVDISTGNFSQNDTLKAFITNYSDWHIYVKEIFANNDSLCIGVGVMGSADLIKYDLLIVEK